MNVEGRVSSKRMLINYLQKSHSLFKQLQNVAQRDKLREKFGNSTLNIEESINIIENELTRDEIRMLVSQIRENIQDEKINNL